MIQFLDTTCLGDRLRVYTAFSDDLTVLIQLHISAETIEGLRLLGVDI